MSFKIIQGNVLEVLRRLPADYVQTIVTSPPYWGLRDYKTEPQVWGGEAECAHEWGEEQIARGPAQAQGATSQRTNRSNVEEQKGRGRSQGAWCQKCGAWRGHLGLEPTPDLYVEHMVMVFREARRVLRPDGTLWLNLGDSYAAGGNGARDPERWPKQSRDAGGFRSVHSKKRAGDGIKPKDLVGIPWMVAFALRAPYYTGRIKAEHDRVWLAAMLDAEGCLFIHKRKAGQSNGQGYERQNDTYSPGAEICNTSREVVERIAALVRRGSISTSEAGEHGRKQTLFRWTIRANECREFVRELYPHLVAKQRQARILCASLSSGERAEAAHEALIRLHHGEETTVDAEAPEALVEPGWWLRSDCIWSKPNPMPESVTDRPTKAHEYLFLLTKSPDYFYDLEAVKEPVAESTRKDKRIGTERPADYEAAAGDFGEGTSASRRTARNATGSLSGRNRRTVWSITTKPFKGAHFAVMPEALVEPCILAGTSERGRCPSCGAPWGRVVERPPPPPVKPSSIDRFGTGRNGVHRTTGQVYQDWLNANPPQTVGWRPTCDCPEHDPIPCVVLDTFAGSGTVSAVSEKLGRKSLGIELNPSYAEMAEGRASAAATAARPRLALRAAGGEALADRVEDARLDAASGGLDRIPCRPVAPAELLVAEPVRVEGVGVAGEPREEGARLGRAGSHEPDPTADGDAVPVQDDELEVG